MEMKKKHVDLAPLPNNFGKGANQNYKIKPG